METRPEHRPIVVDRTRSPEDVYVGRGSAYGNPFRMRGEQDRERVVEQFRAWLKDQPDVLELAADELPGKRLGCYCAPRPCHGDILAEAVSQWHIPRSTMVFDANLAGRHLQGASLSAVKWYGAKKGVGEGLHADSYALPTQDGRLCILPLDGIGHHVEFFFSHARRDRERRFIVSRLGTGLGGYEDKELAPLFEGAPDNVELPARWRCVLGEERVHLVVTGSHRAIDKALFFERLDRHLETIMAPVQIITGTARGAETLAELYAVERELDLRRIPFNEVRFGGAAKVERNWRLLHAATHIMFAGDLDEPHLESLHNSAIAQGLRLLPFTNNGNTNLAAS